MDKLSQFVVNTYSAKPAAKTAAAIHLVEPTAIEKRAYSRALDSIGQDADFLAKFEGTPLAPNAVALAEQELAMEQRRLQRRVQRMATQQSDNWEQDSVEEDTLRIQKQQLLLQLYKMKATTPAPQPGDATIGQPDPAQMQQLEAEADPQAPKTAMNASEGANYLRRSSALLGAGVGALGGGVAGAYKAGPDHRMSGALRGAAAGGVVGGLSGAAMGHGFARSGLADAALIEDLAARQAAISDVAAKGARDPVTRNLILGGLAAAPVGGLAAGYLAGGTAKQSAMATRRREQLGSEIGGGDTGSFPVQEPTPKLSALISKLAAMPSLADVMREPTAYRGKVDPSHLEEMGGNPFLPHPARRAILDEYLKGRAAASQVASPDELIRDHAADAKMTNQFGGAALGTFAGPIIGGALGTAAAHFAKSRDLGPGMVLGTALGVPAGALVGGYLGGKRAITPMTPDEAQRHIQDAHLHREMYAPLAADEAAKEHLLHQLTAKHYEDALQRARAEQYDDFEEDDEPSYRSRNYAAKTAAIQDFARGLRKSAGIADREYMRGPREAVKNISPMTALRYGIPGAFGAVHGAEQVPENRLVGALGGAAGGIGGSELGGMTGRAIHNSTIGELIGRTLGAGAGQDLGARAARLMVT